jgi:hypothetical protein
MLRSFVNKRHDNWDEFLPALEFAYNNSLQKSTGKTPFYLTYAHALSQGLPPQTRWPNPPPSHYS